MKSTQLHDGDVGSSSAQVAILTKRINEITEHMKQNKHDFMARRGLIQMVGRRKKLLKALEQTDYDQYKKVIETLGLRK
ncbi:30S ribosomal protein S15 [Candidatus Saccharibacteria bacterium]|nr:30S ribosomal protein S15 [Candidatus Saccharibacteria bacterium]